MVLFEISKSVTASPNIPCSPLPVRFRLSMSTSTTVLNSIEARQLVKIEPSHVPAAPPSPAALVRVMLLSVMLLVL